MAVLSAAPVELVLPPSGDWSELPDPQPLPATATSRLFVNKSSPDVVLRVMTESQLRLDYSPAVLNEMSRRLVADQKKKGGVPLHVSAPKIFTVDGVDVGSYQVRDPERWSTMFYVPSEGGDRVISLLTPAGKDFDSRPVLTWIESAKGLRKPDAPGAGLPIIAVMGVGSLGTLAVVLAMMRKKKSEASQQS